MRPSASGRQHTFNALFRQQAVGRPRKVPLASLAPSLPTSAASSRRDNLQSSGPSLYRVRGWTRLPWGDYLLLAALLTFLRVFFWIWSEKGRPSRRPLILRKVEKQVGDLVHKILTGGHQRAHSLRKVPEVKFDLAHGEGPK